MFKQTQKNYIIIGIVVLALVGGVLYYFYSKGDFNQCNLDSSMNPCSGGCPNYGANKQCNNNGMMGAAYQKPYVSVPHKCKQGLRNSPSVIPSISPWVKDMYGPAPPVPGCNVPAGKNIDQAFNSCGNIVVDPNSPIGLSLEKCSPQPANPESCLFPKVD